MTRVQRSLPLTAGLLVATVAPWVLAQDSMHERLLEGTVLTREIGPAQIPTPLRGAFDLTLVKPGPLFDEYRVQNLQAAGPGGTLRVTGQGTYLVGGEVAIVHRMILDVLIDSTPVHMDSGFVGQLSRLPSLEITVLRDPPVFQRNHRLHLIAVAAYPVWFSTDMSFHAGALGGRLVSDGDLLSTRGVVIAANHDLTARLGIQPPVPDIGLDALLTTKAGPTVDRVFWFSSEQDVFSQKLGLLTDGDLLSSAGSIVARHKDLLAAFGPDPADAGLDAVSQGLCFCPWFSTQRDFHSATLGRRVGRGDLLAQHGEIMNTNAELLAAFHLIGPGTADLGLDAVYVWPSGEVWFSTEESFQDKVYGPVSHGDLLSDSGWIVARNAELVERFEPPAGVSDFGLDAVFVVPTPKGDLNCDGEVNLDDIDPFILALSGQAAYYAVWPNCNWLNADIDGDGTVNFDDIDPFVALLGGG